MSEAANRDVGSPQIALVNKYGMAHILAHEGREQEALSLLESSLPMAERLGNQELLSSVYIHMGWALSLLQRFSEAQAYLNRGLEISEEYQLLSNVYQANTFLHDIAKEQGRYREALILYDKAQSARKKISNDRNRRYVNEAIFRSEEEKQNNKIELLSRENEIVKLKLRRNQTSLVISGLLLALFTLILYILYRQYQLNNERKMLGLEQNLLRSQMNPHFLFNSLNSIKLYIINNEQKYAVHYLNKFSKLVRKILDASTVREIPLAEELETAELYMNIENIRFAHEIDFKIETEPEIDAHLVKVPSLILQPFLENAIWHGLSPKKGEKSILIKVSLKKKGFIEISITDNGVGRDTAEQLKKSRVLKRKSVGIDITKERLANFSRYYQHSFKLEIVDLFDEEKKAAGTRVIMEIPTI